MGMNLMLYRLTEDGQEMCNDFDSDKYVGDREFAAFVDTLTLESRRVNYEDFYFRPKLPEDFQAARTFIAGHIPPGGNQERLYEVLSRMESDPALFFCCSY